jgi:hypothetical protein
VKCSDCNPISFYFILQVCSQASSQLLELRGRLFWLLITTLDTTTQLPSPPTAPPRWHAARAHFLSIFTTPRCFPVPGTPHAVRGSNAQPRGAGGTGGSGAKGVGGVWAGQPAGGLAGKGLVLAQQGGQGMVAGGLAARSRSRAELVGLVLALQAELELQVGGKKGAMGGKCRCSFRG